MTTTSNKTIAKNTIFLYIRMMAVMIVALYTSRVILNTLGATDYGIYNVVGGIVTIVGFLNSALAGSTSRYLTYALGEGNIEKQKSTFGAALNLHIGVALLVLLIGETIGLWFFYEKMSIPDNRMTAAFWVYQFSIITTMISFTQVPYNASLIAHENMSVYAYVGLYDAFSKLVVAYLITISPIDKLILYGLLLLLNTACIQIFYRFYAVKNYEECHFKLEKDMTLYKQLLSYSGWDLFGNLAVVCQGQGINILLNIFFGPVVNAARAIAYQIQGATSQFVGNFLVSVRPQVIKSRAEGDNNRMYMLTFSSMKYSYFLMLALSIPLIMEMDYILGLWLGDGVPTGTSMFAILVLLNALFQSWHSGYLMAFHAIGRIKTGNLTGGIIMILTLPVSYAFLKLGFNANIVFIILIVHNLLAHIIGMYLIHRYETYSVLYVMKTIYLPCLFISIISIIPVYFVRYSLDSSFVRLVLIFATYEVVLLSSIWFIGLNTNEKEIVKQYIKKYASKFVRE